MNLQKLTKVCQSFLQENPNPGDKKHSLETFKDIYPKLIDCIIQHNHRYYINAEPIISDKDYDDILAYLQKIEEYYPSLISQDSPTQALVGQLSEGFEKAEHKTKLLSLQNSYNEDDLEDFFLSVDKTLAKEQVSEKENKSGQHKHIYYYLEPKFDGISIELIYQDGILIKGITRGDGYVGDDVTNNVRQIENLPHKLKYKIIGTLRLRAEIMMPKSKWKNINKKREKEGLKIFANPRNAAAGTMKLLDSSEVRGRGLLCYIYDVLETPANIKIADHKQMYQELEKLGLPIYKKRQRLNTYKRNLQENTNHKKQNKTNFITENNIISTCLSENTILHFHEQDIDFDGIVIKVNNYNQRNIIGETDHHPKRAIAYKFPATQAATQIERVEFQIGRTGIATPVAHFTPTELSGVTISRASLHNMDYINQKDIRLNDRVRIQRSGEVIPYIVGVITDRRDPSNQKIRTPTHCPSCSTKLKNEEVYVYCPNHHHCIAQIKEQIVHFVSKQCMNIDGLGEKFIQLLIEQQLIKSIADIYELPSKERMLRSMPGFGKKRIEELTKQIKNSKNNELRRLLNGLGLPGIGKKMAKELQKNLSLQDQNLDDKKLIKELQNKQSLESIYGIGEAITDSLRERTNDSYNIALLGKLYMQGISFNNFGEKKTANGILSGIHFSVTGSFQLPRPQIIEQLESYGAIVDNTPTINTHFILTGENPGSKEKKAEQYRIKKYNSIQELQHDYPGINISDKGKKNDNKQPKQQSLF